jgi:uncharacterized protein with PQ loop repeat
MQMSCVAKSEVLVRRLAYFAGLAGPLTALPQAVSIWMSHQATGVSFWSATGFSAVAVIWLTYGVVLREGPIVISSLLWLVLDLAIVFGVWRYGHI